MELPILYFKGLLVEISKLRCIQSVMKICFYLANSADQHEMPDHAAFHLGLHGLPKYVFHARIQKYFRWGWGWSLGVIDLIWEVQRFFFLFIEGFWTLGPRSVSAHENDKGY